MQWLSNVAAFELVGSTPGYGVSSHKGRIPMHLLSAEHRKIQEAGVLLSLLRSPDRKRVIRPHDLVLIKIPKTVLYTVILTAFVLVRSWVVNVLCLSFYSALSKSKVQANNEGELTTMILCNPYEIAHIVCLCIASGSFKNASAVETCLHPETSKPLQGRNN